MPAEWDNGGYDGNADSATISETRIAAGDSSDAYDVDPDVENYAAGNSPETAYRNQGNPDGPNGWSRFVSERAHEETGEGDYEDGADQHTELDETHGASEAPDLWGDIHPDAANYPDLHGLGAAGPEERESPDHRESEPDRDGGADIGQPDQDESAKEATERDLSPEQQRISALEAQIADMKAEYDARFEQQLADQKADKDAQSARIDRIEHQHIAEDAAHAARSAAITEHEDTRPGAVAKEAENTRWRRVVSAGNAEMTSAVLGVADTLTQFATHASPEGILTLGAAAFGLAAVGLAKAEEKRKEKRKEKP